MDRKFLAGSALATLLIIPAAGYLAIELTRNGLPVAVRQEPAGEIARGEPPAPPAARPVTIAPPVAQQVAEEKESLAKSPAPRGSDLNADEISGLLDKSNSSGAAEPSAAPPPPIAAKREQPAKPQPAPAPVSSVDKRNRAGAEESGDRFANAAVNAVKSVATDPISTFSADVDTASYSFVRKSLMGGEMPDPRSVRVEEMINYFPYDWPMPETADQPFKATVTVMPSPWNKETRLMHVAIKGYDIVPAQTPRANLVFLIDVSGSMDEPDKLPLLKSAFQLLVGKLKPDDTVSIVTYAGNAGTVLPPTDVKDKAKILAAIDNLEPGGSTAGAAGIEAAYDLARSAFVENGVNRVILATDGDFNVGPASDDDLKRTIEEERKSGIFLSVLGFGRGNLNDALMQTLAQNGNGTAAYIDTLAEAQKALVQEAGSSLFPIAKDVKFQVEFNPAEVAEYRQIGYETRALNREDFNNDRVDAGDIGSGHAVTAIYEITPKGSPAVMNDDLRYGAPQASAADAATPADKGETAFVKIRYKKPDGDKSTLITTPVNEANMVPSLDAASDDVRFSVAVAAFGQKLENADGLSSYSYDAIADLGSKSRGPDPFGYRSEFVRLVQLAKGLSRQ
jgi:Ca-activated chloride channel family protein